MSATCDCGARERLLLLLDVVELENVKNRENVAEKSKQNIQMMMMIKISNRQAMMVHEPVT